MNDQSPPTQAENEAAAARRTAAIGVACGLGAYLIWGFVPLYFKSLQHAGPGLILAHRTLWSLPLIGLLVVTTGGVPRMRKLLGDAKKRRWLPVTAFLLATNWLMFVICVVTGHVLQSSLAYFLVPLAMALLGVFVLGERLRRLQIVGLCVAAVGVGVLVWASGEVPWMAMIIAGSWSLYGLLRRANQTPAAEGLASELTILSPFAAAWLLFAGPLPTETPNTSGVDLALLALGGLVTATPLLLFGLAATRVKLATLGFLQYLAPTIQLLLGVLLYHEPFGPWRATAFALIWAALLVYTADALRHRHHHHHRTATRRD